MMNQRNFKISTPDRATENGNVLFLILIAVALFAALTFAVVQTRGGGSDANKEKLQIAASQLAQYGGDIEAAILRMRVGKGMGPDVMSFETPFLSSANYTNPDCAIDDCKVYLPKGGAISYNTPNDEWLDWSQNTQPHWGGWLFTGGSCVPGVGLGNDATCNGDIANLELIAIVPYIQRDVCMEINRRKEITTGATLPPQDQGNAWINNPEFAGTFTTGEAISSAGDELFGRTEGCFEGGGTPASGTYHYFKVLIER
ncbi:hypothetical protein [Micavibrio aeruginosavorus]|uniref:hypothetical protein n=1 Tax=Micavibrio aeruginosavorus TaxID=349221 RepID=UPI003F4AAEAA